VVRDASDRVLNSRGLVIGQVGGALQVAKEEPEMFILSPLPNAGTGQGGTYFVGGLAKSGTGLSYPVTLVDSVAQVVVLTSEASDHSCIIAVAQAEDANGNPIFGVSDWDFQLNTGDARFIRLSPAAVKVLPPTPASGPIILTAIARNEGMSGFASLF